jgi:hypothetical protein
MSEWPDPYVPDDDHTHTPPEVHWSRSEVFKAGKALALALIDEPRDIGEIYRQYALEGRRVNAEHIAQYTNLLRGVYAGDYNNFNANDFANVHHVAWLLIGEALASLTNQNPHGDWGDPPFNKTIHFESDRSPEGALFYHWVPNATGYYAVATSDNGLAAPNTGV